MTEIEGIYLEDNATTTDESNIPIGPTDVDAKAAGAVQLFWLLTRTTAAWTAINSSDSH
jgi:hypothetical protein